MTNETKAMQAKSVAQNWLVEIEQAQQRSAAWHKGTYASSNAELYAQLGDCLDFYLRIKSNPMSHGALNYLLAASQMPVTRATSMPLKIVRLMMFAKVERSAGNVARETNYARAISMAVEQGQTGQTFAMFVEQHGGLDGLRRIKADGKTSAGENKGQLAELAKTRLARMKQSLTAEFDLEGELKPKEEGYSLALIRETSDGKGVLVYASHTRSLLDAVLAEAGRVIDKRDAEDAKTELQKKRAQENQDGHAMMTVQVANYMTRSVVAPQPQFTVYAAPVSIA